MVIPGYFAASSFTPCTRFWRFGAFWLPARMAIFPLPSICVASSAITCRAHRHVVAAVEREALRVRRVAVEHHHRHAAIDRGVDGAGDLAGVARRHEDRVVAVVHRLRDPLRLHRAVLVGRREPVDRSRRRRTAWSARPRRSRRRCARTGRPGWSNSWRSARCGTSWRRLTRRWCRCPSRRRPLRHRRRTVPRPIPLPCARRAPSHAMLPLIGSLPCSSSCPVPPVRAAYPLSVFAPPAWARRARRRASSCSRSGRSPRR